MVIYVIDIESVFIFKSKDDSVIAVNFYRPKTSQISFKCMKVSTWKVDFKNLYGR